MPALPVLLAAVLLAVAVALLALGVAARLLPTRAGAIQAALCTIGLLAALLTLHTPGSLSVFTADPLSAILLAALFLSGACGAARGHPAILGALALTFLASDALSLLAAFAATLAIARPGVRALIPALALLLAAIALASHADPAFTAMRAIPPGPIASAIILPATLIAALTLPGILPTLPGALTGLYLLARCLLDLPGPVTPGWWGALTLAAASAAALGAARRAAAANDLRAAVTAASTSVLALAAAALGASLLARAADLLPLAATVTGAALLLVLAWSLWGSLLLLATTAIETAVGTGALAPLGGLLRRTPAAGLATLVGLASLGALPLSAGFAAVWLLLQSVLAAGRAGGTVLLALVAAALAAIGLTLALLAAAGFRLAAAALLGRPRSEAAARAAEPRRRTRLAMAALTAATVLLGLLPGPALALLQPAIRQLAGAPAEGAGLWVLGPGYAAPAILLLFALATAAALAARRGPATAAAQPWTGGLFDPTPAPPPPDLLPQPNLRAAWHTRPSATHLTLLALLLALAAALGWAAR